MFLRHRQTSLLPLTHSMASAAVAVVLVKSGFSNLEGTILPGDNRAKPSLAAHIAVEGPHLKAGRWRAVDRANHAPTEAVLSRGATRRGWSERRDTDGSRIMCGLIRASQNRNYQSPT